MSVDFTAEMSAITAFTFTCGHDNGMTEHRFGNYADAAAFYRAEQDANSGTGHLAVCGDEDCAYSSMLITGIEEVPAPSVNVSDRNGMHLLDLLGIESEGDDEFGCQPFGSMSGEDFLGRVLMATAVSPADAGRASTTERAEGGATVIDCGRRAGYSEDRLAQLRELAEFSIATGRKVQWN
jgi:hypothetical protein